MSWDVKEYNCEIQLLDDLLGTAPQSKSVYAEYVAAKSRREMKKEGLLDEKAIEAKLSEEVAGFDELDENARGLTGFLRDEKGAYLSAHMLKGFLKESGRAMKQLGAMKQLRDKATRFLFVSPDKIRLTEPKGGFPICERPLRAETPMGSRTALARSEVIAAGTKLQFTLTVLQETFTLKDLKALLQYGEFIGLGSWRTSGKGRFKLLRIKEEA